MLQIGETTSQHLFVNFANLNVAIFVTPANFDRVVIFIRFSGTKFQLFIAHIQSRTSIVLKVKKVWSCVNRFITQMNKILNLGFSLSIQ